MTTREEFGNYLLLKKLSDDPMGETFRAGRLGQQGLDQVVLLRVLNGQGLDAEGLWKTLSERKEVQSALKSPNIGSGVDVGRVRGVPYTAYDYISGKDLATLTAQARSEASPFPTDHGLLIADRVGLALTAAYETRHGGERVHHGMVVPHLVMISNEGETRLLGFEAGPALAAQAGSLPEGIRRYLAPEVRSGGGPTKTSDIFSLGAILFELLTGKPLPEAPGGDYSGILGQARLASEGTALPEGVANLLARSLAAPDARLPDPSSWHKALSKIMSEGGYKATTFNLAFFMHNLFREEIERESKEIEAEKTMELPAQGARVASSGAETMRLPQEEVRKAATAAPAPAPPDDTGAVKARYGMDEEPAGSKKGLWIGLAAAVVVAALAVGGWFVFTRQTAAPDPETTEVAAAQVPPAEPAIEPAPEPEPPPEPTGPSQEEIQTRIDALFEEKADAMEANLKAEYDKRIADMQRELDEAQRAAERARREEAARREEEAAAARRAAAEEEEEPEPAPAPTRTEDQPAPASPQVAGTGGAEAPSGPAGEPGETASGGQERQAQAEPTPPPPPPEPAPPPPPPEPAEPEVKRGELVSAGPGVKAPRLLRRATPDYPQVAARLGKEASVDVRVLVDENGKVIEAEVEGRKAGFGFDQEALKAARDSEFKPATKFDVPVKMWTTMRFVFRR